MNFVDSIHNIINKINGNEELAVIFQPIKEENGSIAYIPIGIVSGRLDADNLTFTSDNIIFNHLIKGPKEYGFAFSKTLTDTIKNNKLVPKFIQEKAMLKSLSNFNFIYAKDQNKNPVVGVQSIDNPNNIDILYEEELLNYYIKKLPSAKEIISLLKKASGKLNLDIEEIAKSLENTYTNSRQSKQILTAIWKHYNSDKSYNIFINGNDITPKREIVKRICTAANIPYYYVSSVNNYDITDITDTLKKIIEKNNNNLKAAENTVLIIDNIDKLALTDLSSESFANAQYNLAKILRGETLELEYNRFKKINFDTSKMMIIGMGNFEDDEITDITISGFNTAIKKKKDSKEKYKPGMLEGLFDNFNMIIQMDNPNLDDYYDFLNERDNSGIKNNIEFFNNLNIKLSFSDEIINKIAKIAYDKKMTQSDMKDYIENLLSGASYEISINPNIYEKLEITSDTIMDNKKYILTKRRK